MGKIRTLTTDKAYELQDRMSAQAKADFIAKVMKWEECDYEEAYAICTGHTDPREPEYTLGYKMCDPLYMLAMNAQLSKKRRQQAIANFEAMLEEDELPLFREVMAKGLRQQFKDALHKKEKSTED